MWWTENGPTSEVYKYLRHSVPKAQRLPITMARTSMMLWFSMVYVMLTAYGVSSQSFIAIDRNVYSLADTTLYGSCAAYCTSMSASSGFGQCVDNWPITPTQIHTTFNTLYPQATRGGAANWPWGATYLPATMDSYTAYVYNSRGSQYLYYGRTPCSLAFGASGVYMCACDRGLMPVLTPTVVTTANLTVPLTKSVFSAASDANGNIWFNTMISGNVGGQLYMVPPPYAVNVLTGIIDCAYVWSNSSGSVFYFASGGAIKQIV